MTPQVIWSTSSRCIVALKQHGSICPEKPTIQSKFFNASNCQLQQPTLGVLSTTHVILFFPKSSSFPMISLIHGWEGILFCCSFACFLFFIFENNNNTWAWSLTSPTTTLVYGVPCSTLLSAVMIEHSDQALGKERVCFTYSWQSNRESQGRNSRQKLDTSTIEKQIRLTGSQVTSSHLPHIIEPEVVWSVGQDLPT